MPFQNNIMTVLDMLICRVLLASLHLFSAQTHSTYITGLSLPMVVYVTPHMHHNLFSQLCTHSRGKNTSSTCILSHATSHFKCAVSHGLSLPCSLSLHTIPIMYPLVNTSPETLSLPSSLLDLAELTNNWPPLNLLSLTRVLLSGRTGGGEEQRQDVWP